MGSPPHAVRWFTPGSPSLGQARWSSWHAATEPGRTLCGQDVQRRVNRAERAPGFGRVTCARCRRGLVGTG